MKALALFLISCTSLQAQSITTGTETIDSGGGASTSANYQMTSSSIGGIYGASSSANYSIGSGYVEQVSALEQFMQGIDLKNYASWLSQFPSIPLSDRDRTDDADGDGVSNEDEFLALTDPTDPSSFLTLNIVSVDDTQTDLIFNPYETDITLRTYSLLSRDDLSGPFSAIGSSPASDTGSGIFIDNRSSTNKRFYRLQITIP